MLPYVLIFSLSVFFYLLIPGFGAFYTRSQWRLFRKNIIDLSLSPIITYQNLQKERNALLGKYRFIGRLEAIQKDSIWLKNEHLSISADLKGANIYVLPSSSFLEEEGKVELNRDVLPSEMPKKLSWSRIFSLPEGTKIFIGGPLYTEGGKGIFRSGKDSSLTVVIYDGSEQSILRRSIWGGRQKNEYWNYLTIPSLAAGSFSLFILGYVFLKSPFLLFASITAFMLSLLPFLALAPPGVLLFFIYRNLWSRARFLRGERDLIILPIRFFTHIDSEDEFLVTTLPDGEKYGMRRVADLETIRESPDYKFLSIRTASIFEEKKDHCYYHFGVIEHKNNTILCRKSTDPMIEYLLVPGNPLILSNMCAKRARRLELQAAGVYSAGLLINAVLYFLVLQYLFR